MIIKPKIRGFICTTAHPEGCYKAVEAQVNYIQSQPQFVGPKRVLVIGASTGYGLATRIAATFGSNAKTIGVFYEKPSEAGRTASAGWYNTSAFEAIAHDAGHYAKSINGDAFSDAIKEETAALIKRDLGQVDLVVYSLATPRRIHPVTGETHASVLKPTDSTFEGKTVDVFRETVKDITIEPASEQEIEDTVTVMGGEDWEMWIDFLAKENLLANDLQTVAYSYIGPELTHRLYKEGTIGQAKNHLKSTADKLNQKLASIDGQAMISVDKAVVTQSSAAIPIVPLYISILFKIMKANGTHEGCIEQMYRLLSEHLYAENPPARDKAGYIRIDDLEMQEKTQAEVLDLFEQITTDNLLTLSDLKGYQDEFYRLFGFHMPGIDYDADIDPVRNIASITS